MKNLEGTKTAENLLKAFAGESQARNRYTSYAAIAEKEGYNQLRDIFTETAENERAHAYRFYKFLLERLEELPATVEINASYPVQQGETVVNLKAAANGENEEWTELYPAFAETAKEEGFTEVAIAFEKIADAEKRHESRFAKLAKNIEEDKVFTKDEAVLWKCRNCGYIHEGEEAPEKCPACVHSQEYFELFEETY